MHRPDLAASPLGPERGGTGCCYPGAVRYFVKLAERGGSRAKRRDLRRGRSEAEAGAASAGRQSRPAQGPGGKDGAKRMLARGRHRAACPADAPGTQTLRIGGSAGALPGCARLAAPVTRSDRPRRKTRAWRGAAEPHPATQPPTAAGLLHEPLEEIHDVRGGVLRRPEVEAGHGRPLLVGAEAPAAGVAGVGSGLVLRAVLVVDPAPELDAAELRMRVARGRVHVVENKRDPPDVVRRDADRDPPVAAIIVDVRISVRRADGPIRVAAAQFRDDRGGGLRFDGGDGFEGFVRAPALFERKVGGGRRRMMNDE